MVVNVIEITKGDTGYNADATWLPGSPPVVRECPDILAAVRSIQAKIWTDDTFSKYWPDDLIYEVHCNFEHIPNMEEYMFIVGELERRRKIQVRIDMETNQKERLVQIDKEVKTLKELIRDALLKGENKFTGTEYLYDTISLTKVNEELLRLGWQLMFSHHEFVDPHAYDTRRVSAFRIEAII
jgi:hypothetical protein